MIKRTCTRCGKDKVTTQFIGLETVCARCKRLERERRRREASRRRTGASKRAREVKAKLEAQRIRTLARRLMAMHRRRESCALFEELEQLINACSFSCRGCPKRTSSKCTLEATLAPPDRKGLVFSDLS